VTQTDPFDLQRFVAAQDANETYEHAVEELRNGHKVGHWMWFVFPQIAGLGHSPTAQKFAISSLREAAAYLEHAVLGHRLIESMTIVAATTGRTAEQIFGSIDAQKLHSSATLFLRAAPATPVFQQILDRYFDGAADRSTDRRI
jgi:uncharacterized protein (DUF1810 family)